MTSALFAIPGDLRTLTGGYGYDRRVLAALPACGLAAAHLPLPGGFPFPDAAAVTETLRLLAQAPADAVLLVDGLALGALPPAALGGLAAPLVALVHHPLGLESGLDPATARALIDNERAVLSHVRHVIVTSPTTRDTLIADFGVAAERVSVAEPGTDPAPRFAGSGGDRLEILAIGSITPRKGHGVLIEALAGLVHLPWRLAIIGSPDRDPACAAALRAAIAAHGLEDRVTLAGEAPEAAIGAAYAGADLFVLPSLYEGYGMVLGEAMADLEERLPRPLVLICGTLASKDTAGFLAAFTGLARHVHAVPVPGEHASRPAEDVAAIAAGLGLSSEVAPGVAEALATIAGQDWPVPPRILITGSLYLAGRVLAANGTPPD